MVSEKSLDRSHPELKDKTLKDILAMGYETKERWHRLDGVCCTAPHNEDFVFSKEWEHVEFTFMKSIKGEEEGVTHWFYLSLTFDSEGFEVYPLIDLRCNTFTSFPLMNPEPKCRGPHGASIIEEIVDRDIPNIPKFEQVLLEQQKAMIATAKKLAIVPQPVEDKKDVEQTNSVL